MADKAQSNRNLAQKVVREEFSEDQIREAVGVLLDALLSADKTVWVQCPYCRRKHDVETLDARTRIQALSELQSLGWGRPKADDDEKRAGFVLNRTVVVPSMSEVV